jgi:hypothetical protein
MPASKIIPFSVIHDNEERLLICPESEGRYSSHSKVQELKAYLNSLGLIFNIDFIDHEHNSYACLLFQGKSRALRARYLLKDVISGEINLAINNTRALRLSEHECYVDTADIIKEIDHNLFKYIKFEIEKIHGAFLPKSNLMLQLERDLKAIEKYEDSTFKVHKTFVALGSLVHANNEELTKKTKTEKTLGFKGDSKLAPHYVNLINVIYKNINLFGSPINNEMALDWYNTIVVVRQSQPVPAVPPASAKSQPDQQFTKDFMARFREALKDRRTQINERDHSGRWFQDVDKIRDKARAIENIEKAIDDQHPLEQIATLVRQKRTVLTQSTSTLPVFFRSKVTTEALLEDYGRFMSLE